jgi:hypothetical protein
MNPNIRTRSFDVSTATDNQTQVPEDMRLKPGDTYVIRWTFYKDGSRCSFRMFTNPTPASLERIRDLAWNVRGARVTPHAGDTVGWSVAFR